MAYSDEFRRLVINALNSGEELPQDWQRILFPPARQEVEMTYGGKMRPEEIIQTTLSVPFQPASTFGNAKWDDWTNMLVFGDNLQSMRHLLDLKRSHQLTNADGSDGFRLVYIDPPFATKRDFSGSRQARAYQDKIAGAEFVEFTRRRLALIYELLADDGLLFVHLDQKKVHYIKVILDELFGESNFRNEIIWRNTNAHNKAATFGQIHQTILVYSRSSSFKFNKITRPRFKGYEDSQFRYQDEAGRYERADLTAPETRSGESGAAWGGYNPTAAGRHWAIPEWVYEEFDEDIRGLSVLERLDALRTANMVYFPSVEGGQPRIKRYSKGDAESFVQDIWAHQPYTQGMYENSDECIDQDVTWALGKWERTGYPTQKPEGLLSRIIRAATEEGDLVLDCFAGSGTTLATAEKLGRRWVGIDCGKLSIYTIQKRLLTLRKEVGNRGRLMDASKFTVFNAGLYDYSQLKSLDWESWLFFALELFSCQPGEFRLGGVTFQGTRYGAPVLVHDHISDPKLRLDHAAIRDLHSAIGRLAGSQVYVVAPRNVFRFQEDYLEFDGVRYYALRIPYSFINELHRRQFSAIAQPQTASEVNATVDAVGFDFIEPPSVSLSTVTDDSGRAVLAIDHFETHSRLAPAEGLGRESLAMVMLDHQYDGVVFDMDMVLYPADLAEVDWQIALPDSSETGRAMVVFMDIYGNESRHVFDVPLGLGA